MLSVHYAECPHAECPYAECPVLFIVTLNVAILNAIMLSLVMLSGVPPQVWLQQFYDIGPRICSLQGGCPNPSSCSTIG
jgi:hypothetical protein